MGSGVGKRKDIEDAASNIKPAELFDANLSDREIATLESAVEIAVSAKKRCQKGGQSLEVKTLMEKAGGVEKLVLLRGESEKIGWKVAAARSQVSRPHQQDIIYQGTGLSKLLQDAGDVKPLFDELCLKIVDHWTQKFELTCRYMGAPAKSLVRSNVKVKVNYNGDATLLRDAVRGTIVITSEGQPDLFDQVYKALDDMVENVQFVLPGVDVTVTRFKDKYQHPSGTYRDWQFLFKLNSFVCELQVNFEVVIQQKEAADHKKYEIKRMAGDNLLDASMRGDTTAVQLMLQTGPDPQQLDENKCTPLHYAATYGDMMMCQLLLEASADCLAMDGMGKLALQRSIAKGDRQCVDLMVNYLLKQDIANVNIKLEAAVMSSWGLVASSDRFKDILEKMTELVKKVSPNEGEHTLIAAYGNDARSCKMLIERGSRISKQVRIVPGTCLKGSDLDFAVGLGSCEVAKLLIAAKAHFNGGGPHCRDRIQNTAIRYAQSNSAGAYEALFLAQDICQAAVNHDEVMEVAARLRSLDVLMTLLRHGKRFKQISPAITECFLESVCDGNISMVQLLIDVGVPVNTSNQHVGNALNMAAYAGQAKMCRCLLQNGADPNAESGSSRWCNTPVHSAVDFGWVDVLRVLHEFRADFNVTNPAGKSALDHAGNRIYAKELIEEILDSDRAK